ncbi:MAG: 3-phosphoshikimate 1-carboxyvinyltransferase [Prevotella sp.]|nr:3-phosphoshikimate 1-carboxyvinyltransferase [Prevotella sp.]
MTQYTLFVPERLDATVELPASKSISNRALIIHALARGWQRPLGSQPTTDDLMLPKNLSDCDDTEVTVRALKEMPDEIDIKAAGTAMRFMAAFLAATPNGEHTLTGTDRMKHRPIGILVDALRYLGADISYAGEEGFPPLRIVGKHLEGGRIEVPGGISSQYISALLMIGPALENGLELRLTGDIISRPYIDLTISVMHSYGAKAEWTGIDTIRVEPKPYVERDYLIENDWSAASYWYEMLALSDDTDSEIRLTGLIDGSRQGDSSARYIFSLLGIKTVFETTGEGVPTTVTLKKNRTKLPRLDYNFVNSPDLAQTFVVCCAMMNIPFHFTGLATLKIKETDRIEALKREMRKLGFVLVDVGGSELRWDGERCEPMENPVIDTYDDHRMALSFAPAASKIPGLRINNPGVVSKSYPAFWTDLEKAGVRVEKEEL